MRGESLEDSKAKSGLLLACLDFAKRQTKGEAWPQIALRDKASKRTTGFNMPTQHDIAAPSDFDFMIGDWQVRHRRLNSRLTGCTEWTEFDGISSTRKMLNGFGNVEDNLLHFPEADVRAAAFRSFDPATRTWAIWWLDGRAPHTLDVPVVGSFVGPLGTFFANDTLDNKPIKVRFTWNSNSGGHPTWEQAFSGDGGSTWETNWVMEFKRNEA